MKQTFRWLLRLIGPALLIYILATTDLPALAVRLAGVDPWPLLLSLALMPIFVAVKAWRWNLLMQELGLEPPPLSLSIAIYTVGLFLGGATPGQSGDFVKAWYLRDRGQPLAPTLFSILLDRLFDFMIMAPLALLALVTFATIIPEQLQPLVVVAAVLFILTTPLLMARGPREWAMGLALRIAPAKLRPAVERWRDQFGSLSLRPVLLLNLMLASIGSALSTMVRIYLLFVALHLFNVPLLAIVASTALIALLQTLPISFSGVGVRDVVLIAVLALYGYSQEQAVALSALFLVLNFEHIIVGFLVSLRYPLGQKPGDEAVSAPEQGLRG